MEGIKEEITGVIRTLNERIKQGKDIADLYTEDGVLLPPGEPSAIGRDSISKVIKKYYEEDKMVAADFNKPVIKVFEDGKNAYSWHSFNLYNSEGKIFIAANCVMVWKRDEVRQEWLAVLEIFNEAPSSFTK